MTDIAKYHGWSRDQLQELSTRQLMSIRAASFKMRGCSCGAMACEGIDDRAALFNENQLKLQVELRAVLLTREHIPNKKEAKALRQAAAKNRNG